MQINVSVVARSPILRNVFVELVDGPAEERTFGWMEVEYPDGSRRGLGDLLMDGESALLGQPPALFHPVKRSFTGVECSCGTGKRSAPCGWSQPRSATATRRSTSASAAWTGLPGCCGTLSPGLGFGSLTTAVTGRPTPDVEGDERCAQPWKPPTARSASTPARYRTRPESTSELQVLSPDPSAVRWGIGYRTQKSAGRSTPTRWPSSQIRMTTEVRRCKD